VADLSIDRDMYATHTYFGEITFERPEGGTKIYDPVNVQVTSPAGTVRRLRLDGTRARLDLTPYTGGELPLTVSWDQQDLATETIDCSASVTITRTIGDALPVLLWPVRGKTVYGKLGPGYGFSLHLFFATQGSNREAWEKADMTPLRVEARAVKRARRPSRSLPPAAIEFVPGATKVLRSTEGVVQVRRARPQVEPYEADIVVATRKGRSKRGLTLDVSQGTRVSAASPSSAAAQHGSPTESRSEAAGSRAASPGCAARSEPSGDGRAHSAGVLPQAVVAGHFDHLAVPPGRRHAEAVARALHHEHRHRDRLEFVKAIRRRWPSLAGRRLKRECEAEYARRASGLGGAAGHARARRAPAWDERQAAQLIVGEPRGHGDPRGVELMRRW
jgi:hypothetical protein